MGTFREGRVVYVDRLPEQRLHERTSAVREGDRWIDREGDMWFVVATEDGPRMQLSGLNDSLARHRVAMRTAEYVQSEYGPILLRWRAGREVLARVELRSAQ